MKRLLFCAVALAGAACPATAFFMAAIPATVPTRAAGKATAAIPSAADAVERTDAGRPWKAAVAAAATFAVGLSGAAPAAWSASGVELFTYNCAACHIGGTNIVAFGGGKTLKKEDLNRNGYADAGKIADLVKQGKGAMPQYGAYTKKNGDTVPAKLSDGDVAEVSKYILQRAGEDWK